MKLLVRCCMALSVFGLATGTQDHWLSKAWEIQRKTNPIRGQYTTFGPMKGQKRTSRQVGVNAGCYCTDRKLVLWTLKSSSTLFHPPLFGLNALPMVWDQPRVSMGLICNYNKIWVRVAVWVRKWIDGSDQVSESLLTTGMGPSQDWALQVV